jgi:hypothetical protein
VALLARALTTPSAPIKNQGLSFQMYAVKFLKNFFLIKKLDKKDTKTNFFSDLYLAEKQKHRKGLKEQINKWYLKPPSIQTKMFTLKEVIAQEFFRLILPRQPKTRMVMNESGKEYYVISREIVNFRPFTMFDADELNSMIISGKYRGLGEILVLSLFVNEVDLSLHNLGVDETGHIVKVDGGCCFANLSPTIRGGKKYEISKNDLNTLPFLSNYEPYNWLDIFVNEAKYRSKIIAKELPLNEEFRHEINNTVLKILLLSSAMFQTFVRAYDDDLDITSRFVRELWTRKDQLRERALSNQSFQTYLNSNLANETLAISTKQVCQFKPAKKEILFHHVHELFNHRFEEIRTYANTIQELQKSFCPMHPNQ